MASATAHAHTAATRLLVAVAGLPDLSSDSARRNKTTEVRCAVEWTLIQGMSSQHKKSTSVFNSVFMAISLNYGLRPLPKGGGGSAPCRTLPVSSAAHPFHFDWPGPGGPCCPDIHSLPLSALHASMAPMPSSTTVVAGCCLEENLAPLIVNRSQRHLDPCLTRHRLPRYPPPLG